MTNKHTLFPRVQDYYADLVTHLNSAQKEISMTCLAFEDGLWPRRILQALVDRAAGGIPVRLMVDQLGQVSDEPRTFLTNYHILENLRSQGVQVDVFHPALPGLSIRNRMHCKFCAIDDDTLYIGGSNVADYYTTWSDTNLRLDGNLGSQFHETYDYLRSFSHRESQDTAASYLPGDTTGDQLCLTIPGMRRDVRQALLNLIRNADREIHLRTWYFLPDAEIMDLLCAQAEQGVTVNVLLSNKTRIRPVDLANVIHIQRLVLAGGRVFRYARSYMHAKVAWNEHGEVLLGSANLDAHSMSSNFESCLLIQDEKLTRELQQVFDSDLCDCLPSTPESYTRIPLPGRLLSHTCNLASPWL